MSWGRKSVISVPYLWLTLFFLVPFITVFKVSFSEMDYAIPPYTDLLTWANEQLTLTLNLGNYAYLFTDDLYIRAYLSSIFIAAIATVICLLPTPSPMSLHVRLLPHVMHYLCWLFCPLGPPF